MQITQSQHIATKTLASILENFKQQLHVKKLTQNLPQFAHKYVTKTGGQEVFLGNYPQPTFKNPLVQQPSLLEDQEPYPVKPDQFAAYYVKTSSINDFNVSLIQKHIQTQQQNQVNSRFRKTPSTRKASSFSKRKKYIEPENLQKYHAVPSNQHTDVEKLAQQVPTQQQVDLEIELRALQKRLYETRKLKQQNQENQRKKLVQIEAMRLKNRQKLPKSEFTYSFEGKFMKRKKLQRESFDTSQMISKSFDQIPHEKGLKNETEYTESQRGRSNLMSRFRKAQTFNNFNKRQVSHFPFLKMSDNTTIKEYGKFNQGNKTQRISLKRYAEKNEDKSFRHHHQIQKQKREKQLSQLLRKRQQQIQKSQKEDNPQLTQLQTQENTTQRRHSYMLNRYFKKIRDQNIEPIRKSMNFSPTNFPKNTPIHNFYRHNFDKQRSLYQSQAIAKFLDS